MRRQLHSLMLAQGLAALLVAPTAVAQSRQIQPEAWAQIQALLREKATWSEPQRKIASRLLLEIKRRTGDPLFDALPQLRSTIDVDADGRVLVDLRGEITPPLLQEVALRQGTVVSSSPQHGSALVSMPLDHLEQLAASPDIRSIRPAERVIHNKVDTSEGDVAHAADTSRTAFGVNGSGVTVGVISDGVEEWEKRRNTGDLPPTITILTGRAGSGQEGTAMLEIIYDLAPGASLLFATGLGGQAQMAQNILDLEAAGADVIVDSLVYLGEPVFQDGVIAQAVETVTAAGVNYFSSAGNGGNLNDGEAGVWEGDFVGIPAPSPLLDGLTANDFGGGMNYNEITSDPPFGITLQWSDASGASGNDYDLLLLDPTLSVIFDAGADVQDGDDDPFEFIDSVPYNDNFNALVVIRFSGEDRYLHMNTVWGRLDLATDGQTWGHAAAEGAFGVAAVDVTTAGGEVFSGGAANPVEFFSADGPRKVFYEADGTEITPGNLLASGGLDRLKPDVAAADGVDTATIDPFFGTSAAASHVAAIAALMQENGNLTTEGMRSVFAGGALDIEAPGPDRDSGFGVVMADVALAAVSPTSSSCGPSMLTLSGKPNDGPQTFRACDVIRWENGEFSDLAGRAPTHIFADGFESGDNASWTNAVP